MSNVGLKTHCLQKMRRRGLVSGIKAYAAVAASLVLGIAARELEAVSAAPQTPTEPLVCASGQFACADGLRCVPASWRCDTRAHCADASDELHCTWNTTCGAGQFRCAGSGLCIAASWRCDGDPDCGPFDASDEDPYMCEKDFKCPGNWARCATPIDGQFSCSPVASFCDGARNCIDASDEWDICDNFTTAACGPLKCELSCRPTHNGLACYCHAGYEPDATGRCIDSDECRLEESCAQQCRNTAGSYACACAAGYRLHDDRRDCVAINDPESEPMSLVVATQTDVRRLTREGNTTHSLNALNVQAIDIHYSERKICYVHHNITKSGIVCVSADDFSKRKLFESPALLPDVSGVSHLAIDWVASNWYLVDSVGEALYVCSWSLAHCRLLADTALDKMHGFALDPATGFMFWTVWGASPPVVERALLSGEGRSPIANLKLVYPGAVTLDPATRTVYWADAYLECVERVDYSGENRRTVRRGYSTQKLQHISILETTLFLPVWSNRSIAAVSRYSRERSRDDIRLDARPTAALVFHRQRQPKLDHPCARSNGGCQQICITAYKDSKARAQCMCRHGFRLVGHGNCVRVEADSYLVVARGSPAMVQALSLGGAASTEGGWEPAAPAASAARPTAADVDLAGRRLYYCDVHRYEIVRQNLDGSGREVFIGQDVDNCEGLAIDWMGRNVYWTDDALGQVCVSRLDEPRATKILIQEHDYNPRSIALHPANGTMFWSVWASATQIQGRIETAFMDGTKRRILIDSELHWPNGLAMTADGEDLYWCDTYLNKIERMHLSKGTRELVAVDSQQSPLLKPYGLALYEGQVIWSEHGTGAIRRLNEDGSVTVLYKLPPPLYELKLVSNTVRRGGNACSFENGACAELCLATPSEATCACGEGREPPSGSPRTCAPLAEQAKTSPARCPDGRFHCGRGNCIEALYVCDGDLDCPDGSDEDSSPSGPCANVTCSEEQSMQCDTNRCISNSWVCDGLKDCFDGSDETAAACARTTCGLDQFACAQSRRCIPAAWRCDGAPDCGRTDLSDEQDCLSLECSGMFTCVNGACLPWEYYCDGRADCADASDERACRAAPLTTPAPNHLHPHHDTGICEFHEFQCNNSECIRKEFRCDAHVDCLDGTDELDCGSKGASTPTTAAPISPASPPEAECSAPAVRCDNGSRCVPLLQLCDGNMDCADGADEADRCGEPMCALAACSHECRPTPGGPACACPPPLHLQRDGLSCALEHPCTEWGVCSQSCKPQKNRYKCTCDEGYRLADDGFTCKSTEGATPLLVFSNRHEVRAVELPALAARALISSLKNTIALDWRRDPASGATHLYWTDVVDDNIYRGVIVGNALSGIEAVVRQGLSTAEGLAVDWVAGNLYWVESSLHQIEVARLDGEYRRTLIAGDMDSPRAIAADPRFGYLFWSDWEAAAPRIERCSLAGRDRRAVVRVDALSDGAWPNGISLDYRAKRLYWIDARSDSIHTTTYDGGDHREVLRGHPALSHPFAITVFESHVYWTDWRSNSVARANKWNGSDVTVVQRTLTQPFDVKVIHPSRQPASAHNPCGAHNGGCSHLCLIDSATARLCACPHVMRLAADNVTCEPHEKVLLIGRAGEIRGVDLEAPLVHMIPTVSGPHLTSPATVHFDAAGAAIYWADVETNEIKRTNLTGGGVRVIADSGVESPRGFALDWAAGLLYYSTGSALAVCNLGGEYTTLIYKDSLDNITALAVDPKRGKLYWAVSPGGVERIESANGDGGGRRTLLDATSTLLLSSVTSMCVDSDNNRLYWVNAGSGTMQYLDLTSRKLTTLETEASSRPLALEVYEGEVIWADGTDSSVRACDKLRCAPNTIRLLRNNTEGVISLRVYDAATQRATRGACAARRSPCAHLCLPVSETDSECRCATGYTRTGAACTGVDEIVVYSVSWEVRGVPLNASNATQEKSPRGLLPPVPQLSMASAIDYNAEGEWMYWADSEAGCVWRVRRDGTRRELVVHQPAPFDVQPADWPAGLAVDWVARNVYWSDPRRNLVEVARLNGTKRYVLLDTDPMAVTSLAVDPVRGWLFLAGGGWIQRCRLDGSQRDLLHNGSAVTDITLHSKEQHVYWVDARGAAIWRMRYDGSTPAQLASFPPQHWHPVAIAVYDALYWLDTTANRGSVLSAPFNNVTNYRVLRDNVGDSLKDIMIWSRAAQPEAPGNGCGTAQCNGLCLFDGTAARCACPHGRLASDNVSCTPYDSFLMYSRVTEIDSIRLQDEKDLNSPYPPIKDKELMRNAISLAYEYNSSRLFYSDIQRGAINTVLFNGSNHEALLEQVGAVEGMVFAAGTGMLYWTSNSGAAIRGARADALLAAPQSARAALVVTVLRLPRDHRPRGIDFEPCESRLYWTNWNDTQPAIQRAYTSGRELQSIVTTDILMPNGLAIDHQAKKIYWADARMDKIERMHYDGSHRHVVTRSSTEHPFDVAVAGDWVFWTDWLAHGVFRADKRAGGAEALRRDVPRPMAVVAVTPDHQTCSDDPCATLNGGCAEICTPDASGTAACSCAPGRTLAGDGRACRPDDLVCPDGQFACAEGACIPEELVCDGTPHCGDATSSSDEDLYYCTSRVCPSGAMRCGTGGRCVGAERMCDGRVDCDDGADEAACDCPPTHYKCDDGVCVDLTARCDGDMQCPDGSDERGCPACLHGECVLDATTSGNATWTATTEAVKRGCESDQFTCGDGQCIPLLWRCDGRADCADASDETLHCGGHRNKSCTSEQFSCGGGEACIPASVRCDGAPDCPAGEDEVGCVCEPFAFRCAADELCISETLYCDGNADCADGSDEPSGCVAGGPSPAGGGASLCAGADLALRCAGRCVSRDKICDGRDHCMDGGGEGAGSDEDPEMCSSYARAFGTGPEESGMLHGACSRGEWQCGNGACVPRAALCDGEDDCGDYGDERRCGINECLVRSGSCAHNCTDLPVGRACWCRVGWRRRGPGACADVDECVEDEPCDHHCRNTLGSFVCSCSEGYKLMPDGVTCTPNSSVEANLIFTNRYYIRRASLNGGSSFLLVHNLTNAVAMDMEWSQGCLYWSDVTRLGSSIKRVCRTKHEPAALSEIHGDDYQLLHGATLQNPDGLAVDWVGGNVYWCDKGTDTLEVSRRDGAHRRVLLRGALAEPRALALHPRMGWIFWSDWGEAPHIGRAGMDGSQRRVLIAVGLGWPNALTISYATDELYFADAREDYIAVSDLDGKHFRVLFSRDRMPWLRLHHVFALAVWDGRVYWSDWETRAIESCRRRPNMKYKETNSNSTDLSGGGAYECRSIVHTVHKPMDLHIFHPARQPPVPELSALCAALNCSGLCLLTPASNGTPVGARCECPEHWALAPDGRSCLPNCSSAHFVCATALKCIPFWWRCDTQDDCGDGSDEPASCPPFRCSPGQFQCDDGRCVHPSHICDGIKHCADGSDEMDCDKFTCLSSQWKCHGNATAGVSARCVPQSMRCDGRRDCHDNDDEIDCPPRTCPPHHFTCGSGACVPLVWVCDADEDCGDGSDEGAACRTRTCARDHFRCRSGRCIPRAWLCDDEMDCPSGEDEKSCSDVSRTPAACDATYFRCPDGRCIPGRWRCDLEDDCGDGADEMNCQPRQCSESEFRCGSGECVRSALRCSGVSECADGSDEAGCAAHCASGARACADGRRCVLAHWWCDGEPDCSDDSDEANCTLRADEQQRCGSRLECGGTARCAPSAWRCDGRRDCADGGDELATRCSRQECPPDMFRCHDFVCLPTSLVCDGFADCYGDESPELCHWRRWLGEDSLCTADEKMCYDGRCVPAGAGCEPVANTTCKWNTCSQICLPKHDNHTCKCVPGFKQRQLPDGTLTCEAVGEKAQVIVAEGGALRVWRVKHGAEHDHALDAPLTDRVEITSVTGALVNGTWWVWWADEGGRIFRRNVTSVMQPTVATTTLTDTLNLNDTDAELIVRDGGAVRGLAVDWVSQRLYWTAAPGVQAPELGGAVYCATLDGRRRVTLHRRAASEPDDIVIHNDTREMFWSERGATPGVRRAGLAGGAARWLARRRVRRVAALALHAPARRLYFVDAYYGTMESVRLDGAERTLVAEFTHRPSGTPTPPHVYFGGELLPVVNSTPSETANATLVFGRPCQRAYAWEEWIWCTTSRGLLRLPRRSRAPNTRQPRLHRSHAQLTGIVLLHPSMFNAPDTAVDPCVRADGRSSCDGSALCVRSSEDAGFACLCPDGLIAEDEDAVRELRKCVISRGDTPTSESPSINSTDNATCSLPCGAGACVMSRSVARCRCHPLYGGSRCQHYRCAHHCHRRGRCQLDTARHDVEPPPLMCTCYPGFTGERCELTTSDELVACARLRCEHGGQCQAKSGNATCVCMPGYTGSRCERCTGGPGCVDRMVDSTVDADADADICKQYTCLNQGTCTVSAGRVSCVCAGAWTGERCQRPACVDAACAHPPGAGDGAGNDGSTRSNRIHGDIKTTTEPALTPCSAGECLHGGRCLATSAGGVCACSGAWGGARCALYLGHDHDCAAKACPPPSICAWGPDRSSTEAGSVFCACLEGARCSPLEVSTVSAPVGGASAGAGGAWAGAVLALLALGAAVLAALYLLHRRRPGAWSHERLADNVEINNPMYLAGEDEEPGQNIHAHTNGGSHFANPVYESMYAPPQNNAPEEHANLLAEAGDGSPPPAERAALL